MNLASLTIARNESWVIGLSLRVALMWCDATVVLLHCCVDRTREIVEEVSEEYPGRVTIIEERGATWAEMSHRQRTLEEARRMGATHCAVVDADELLAGDLLPTIRADVEKLRPGTFAGIPLRNLHRSLDCYRSDTSVWGQSGTMIAFADSPALCWRARDGYDHHHRSPLGSVETRSIGGGGVMHLQFASRRRLAAKHAWYKMIERVRWPEKSVSEIERVYNLAMDERGVETAACPREWWQPYEHLRRHVDLSAAPWQEKECARLWREYGAVTFDGLDLFGVVRAEVAA